MRSETIVLRLARSAFAAQISMNRLTEVESAASTSPSYAPISGEVVAVNDALDGNPAAINSDPYGDGWMIAIRANSPADVDGLLDAAAYEKLIG